MSALGNFEADLERWQSQLGEHMDEMVQNIVFALAEEIIVGKTYSPGTPIDTGFARASWWVSIGGEGTPHQVGANPERLVPTQSANLADVVLAKAGDEIYLLTNTEYMPALEFGHSEQAPQGMVRLTLNAGQQIVDDVAVQMGAV